MTLTVTARNDLPHGDGGRRRNVRQGRPLGHGQPHRGRCGEPPAELTLSAASSNPTLVPTGNVNFAGSGAARTMTVSTVDGRSGTAILTVTVSDGQASGSVEVTVKVGGGGKDTLTGGNGADLLLAQSNNDTLTGGDGNDLLCGDSGSDTLSGGAGDDSLGGGSGSDRLTGGSGADRFSGGSGTDTATDFTATEGDTTNPKKESINSSTGTYERGGFGYTLKLRGVGRRNTRQPRVADNRSHREVVGTRRCSEGKKIAVLG